MVAIDWAEALTQAGQDELFLEEVLEDLFHEISYHENGIIDGISSHNFEWVINATIQIKECASYLYCHDVVNSVQQLRNYCRIAENGDVNSTWTEVERLYEHFKSVKQELITEVISHSTYRQNRNNVINPNRTHRTNSESTASLSEGD